ncbi:MAG: hypothetical protein KGL39_03565 [Patescibacteria group bacterium]|nr:hypothetical protein [Patescibacteria group bacterium]
MTPGSQTFKCTITCDGCSRPDHFQAETAERLDEIIARAGWVRFSPTGSDLCAKCRGSSPNMIIQVRKPCP